MNLAPHKEISASEQMTLADLIQDRLSFLGIETIIWPPGLKQVLIRPHVKCRRSPSASRLTEDAIVILSPGTQEKLFSIAEPVRDAFIANLALCNTALVVLAQTTICPASLREKLRRRRIPAAVSALNENLLESRFKAIISEKIRKCVTLHGIAAEVDGRGLLVRGPSGIGKTTTLLQAVGDGYVWIADDRVVVRKDRRNKLVVSGEKRIGNYFHTKQSGIMAVNKLIHVSHIKKKAELAFVIDVIRKAHGGCTCRLDETEILDTRLPRIEIQIPRTGYFNRNLLSKAIQEIGEVA